MPDTPEPEPPDGSDLLGELQDFLAAEDERLDNLDTLLEQLRAEAHAQPAPTAPDRAALWGRIRAQVAPG